MSNAITRCPKCSTSFRITEAHLKSAKGAVRCGSCLNIFNAKENLVSKPEPEPEPIQDEEDDILISDDMSMESDAKETEQEDDFEDTFFFSKSAGQHETNLFERELVNEDDNEDSSDDESWALNLLEDTNDEEPQKEAHPDTRRTEPHFDEENQLEASTDSSYAQEDTPKRTSRKSAFQIIDDEPPETPSFSMDDDEGEETHYAQSDSTHYPDSDDDAGNFQFIHSIEPEPVEFTYKTHRNWTQSKLLWVPLILIAAITLVAQVAWYKFDDLSTQEPYRGLYGKVCPTLGCQLPALIDRSKIKATNLIVRSHPEAANALLVDAIIQNNAKFQQSYPSLDLVFTDLQSKPVAARRITPSDYLGGELTGKTQMPIMQPVHIAIEIADPGPEAVSYFISIPD